MSGCQAYLAAVLISSLWVGAMMEVCDNYQCANNDRCISYGWICDGDNDCPENDDENHCTTASCSSGQHKCSYNGRCISLTWICDNDRDCPNGEDEKSCAEIDHGNECIASAQCRTNTLCHREDEQPTGACRCVDGYFWNTTACRSVVDLRVENITVAEVTTTAASLRWTAHNFGLAVTYGVTVNGSGAWSFTADGDGLGGVVTGLMSGTVYGVTITSTLGAQTLYEELSTTVTEIFSTKQTYGGSCDGSSLMCSPDLVGVECLPCGTGMVCRCPYGQEFEDGICIPEGTEKASKLNVEAVAVGGSLGVVVLVLVVVLVVVLACKRPGRSPAAVKGSRWPGIDRSTSKASNFDGAINRIDLELTTPSCSSLDRKRQQPEQLDDRYEAPATCRLPVTPATKHVPGHSQKSALLPLMSHDPLVTPDATTKLEDPWPVRKAAAAKLEPRGPTVGGDMQEIYFTIGPGDMGTVMEGEEEGEIYTNMVPIYKPMTGATGI